MDVRAKLHSSERESQRHTWQGKSGKGQFANGANVRNMDMNI